MGYLSRLVYLLVAIHGTFQAIAVTAASTDQESGISSRVGVTVFSLSFSLCFSRHRDLRICCPSRTAFSSLNERIIFIRGDTQT